ncbi:hypothetical protein L9F63_002468 [Diploptera punctata]|uniref:Uncharacterized protein n=1 Tax=Diploptera punctata TaxID=6984 RepID=A0AAD7ZS23_DIPPU|nr:hypothetical protein L9F63_002468 [Diploptera punctata]
MCSLISTSEYTKLCILAGAATAGFTGLVLFLKRKPMITPSEKQAIFITGCDSGLGFSLALFAHKLGLTVFAGCLQSKGTGAEELKEKCKERFHIIEVDITNTMSVSKAVDRVKELINTHNLELKALINNAGIMIFGELEWLTENHIMNQINTNLGGTIRITKYLCPLLRKYNGRIITISSHCALTTLPTLSVYAATKAGIVAWCDGLRIELAKYGIPVIVFIPGSFPTQTNIMARQSEYAKEMRQDMTDEYFNYFGDYFMEYNAYLSCIPTPEKPIPVDDDKLHAKFQDALLAKYPKQRYLHEPFRYAFYHFLFKISPSQLRDYFIQRFMQTPTWKKKYA